jgi:hypothetical protein
MKARKAGGQPVAGDGVAGHDAQAAALKVAVIGQRQFGSGGAAQDGARLGKEHGARFAQLYAAAHAVKQRHAVPGFQRRNRIAGGRLGDAQHLCRLGDMLPFGNGDEDAKLLQRHGRSFREGLIGCADQSFKCLFCIISI